MERSQKESEFFSALRGVDDSAIATLIPKVIRYLANEINLLGEYFVTHTLEMSSFVDDSNHVLIDFDALVNVMLKFQYICSQEDRNELRVWLFNHDLFANTPKYYDKNTIFINLDTLIDILKKEVSELYPG